LVTSDKSKKHHRAELWLLFTAAAFPIHIWAIIILLMDVSWVAERTNFQDALGFIGYGLSFSLLECSLIWLCLVLVGILFLKKWDPGKRVAFLSTLVWLILLGAMLAELINSGILPYPRKIIPFLESQQNPALMIVGVLFAMLSPVAFLLVKSSLGSRAYQSGLINTLKRISPLMVLYLVFDILGLLIVFIRNLRM